MPINDSIPLLKLTGTPYDMGLKQGQAFKNQMIELAEDRIQLSGSTSWTGHEIPPARVLELAEACVDEHVRYSEDLTEELRGMSDATGLSMAELIVLNGFTDFIDTVYALGSEASNGKPERWSDNCTAFIVPDHLSADGKGFFGQTWDMHATAAEHVVLLQIEPEQGPSAVVFTSVGCVGMIGVNEAGIAVGINNLAGADGQLGVTWPFVIRKMLAQTRIEDALACLTEAKLAGAHNYVLFDKEGKGFNVEAMGTAQHVSPLEQKSLVHTNHCTHPETLLRERERSIELQDSSLRRKGDAEAALAGPGITVDDLMALTRDTNAVCTLSKPPNHVMTCGAAIMQPSTGKFWAVKGLPSENEYEFHPLPLHQPA
jgi:isopenicillin-N N-acyltransferase-like protein